MPTQDEVNKLYVALARWSGGIRRYYYVYKPATNPEQEEKWKKLEDHCSIAGLKPERLEGLLDELATGKFAKKKSLFWRLPFDRPNLTLSSSEQGRPFYRESHAPRPSRRREPGRHP